MPTIAMNDANIVYSPANWLVTAAEARTMSSGAYFRAMIGGATTITLTADLTGVTGVMPKVAYRVDDGPWTRIDLAASMVLTMPTTNAWARRTLEFVYDTKRQFSSDEWSGGTDVAITGIVVDAGATVAIPTRPKKGVQFGDSITRGTRTLSTTSNADARDHSTRQGWAWNLTNHMNAEVGVIGIGGSGWDHGGAGDEPDAQEYVTTFNGTLAPRDLTGLDWIGFNLGTNDAATTATTTAVTTTLNNVLAACDPETKIIVFRPFNGTAAAQIVAGIAACNFPGRVTYVDTTGWWDNSSDANDDDLHPFGNWNRFVIAPKVAEAIDEVLNAGGGGAATGRWIKTSTGLVAV